MNRSTTAAPTSLIRPLVSIRLWGQLQNLCDVLIAYPVGLVVEQVGAKGGFLLFQAPNLRPDVSQPIYRMKVPHDITSCKEERDKYRDREGSRYRCFIGDTECFICETAAVALVKQASVVDRKPEMGDQRGFPSPPLNGDDPCCL